MNTKVHPYGICGPGDIRILIKLSRAKYLAVYQYAVMIPVCFWHALNSVYLHRKLTREGFYDKSVPDTSNAEQEYLF